MERTNRQNAPEPEETDFRRSKDWTLPVILGNIVSVLIAWAAAWASMVLSDGFIRARTSDEGMSSILCIVVFVACFVICSRIARRFTR